MTGHFVLDGFDFGIDSSRSRLTLSQGDDLLHISMEIHSDPDRFKILQQQEPAKWGWCLYEPSFYAHDINLACNPSSSIPDRIKLDETTYDGPTAIYFHEHLELLAWRLVIEGQNSMLAEGYVSVTGTDWSKYSVAMKW